MASFWGTKQSETIIAKSSNDIVLGLDGDDTLFGMGGDDILKGGGGADKLYGGAGSDTADYSDSWQGVSIDLYEDYGAGGTAKGDHFDSIENLNGSAYADHLRGTAEANILNGQGDNDELWGWAGDDILDGGAGDDRINGGSGPDKMNGGPGEHDVADYYHSPDGVFVSLLDDIAQFGDAEGDTLDGFEDLWGSREDDSLWGDHGANRIVADEGDDTLKGYGGNDSLLGNLGNDYLLGGDGDDVLHGHGPVIQGKAGVGDVDTLVGGMGRDTLYGGYDPDTFVWLSTAETNYAQNAPTSALDVIQDFNFAEGDRIDLSFVDADISVPGNGNQAFTFIGAADFSGTPGELRYRYEGGNTIIEMQTGTSGDPEGAIVITGIHTPAPGWFVL